MSGCRCRRTIRPRRENELEVRAELVAHRDSMLEKVFAGAHVSAQGHRGWRVGFQARPSVSVGAKTVRQHVGVGAVRFVG